MVYGAAFCTQAFAQDKLVDLGFADSKTLTHKRREELLEMIVHPPVDQPLNQRVEWNVKVLTPADISQGMNRRTPYNLYAHAHDRHLKKTWGTDRTMLLVSPHKKCPSIRCDL